MPITLCASSRRSLAFCVCLILMLFEQFRKSCIQCITATYSIGVNAAVILPKPLCEVVRNKYFSISSSFPTFIYSGGLAVIKIRSPLLNAPAVSHIIQSPPIKASHYTIILCQYEPGAEAKVPLHSLMKSNISKL